MLLIRRSQMIILAGLLPWAAAARADEIATAGREILAKHQNAVVTVKLVMKISGHGLPHPQEAKTETTGTVIDPSGLTLVSLATTDPTAMASKTSRGGQAMDMKSDLSDVKIVFGDETEVPGQVVLRDNDLDMAFIRPLDKLAKPADAVDLTQDTKPNVLDDLLIIGRLGEVASRVPAVTATRVRAVVEKPRTFYVLRQESSDIGAPVFANNGKLVGMILLRFADSQGGADRRIMTVILPAAEILEAAKQAPQAEKKKAEPTKTEPPPAPAK